MVRIKSQAYSCIILIRKGIFMSRKLTAAEFFEKNNAAFMKFGRLFTRKLTDVELISALAEKDLEKLAKVFKLVF